MTEPIVAIPSLIALRKEIGLILKNCKEELAYLLDDGLLNYALGQKAKFEKLKTFLYRNDLVNFYDTYFPLNLKGVKVTGEKYIINVENNLKNSFQCKFLCCDYRRCREWEIDVGETFFSVFP